MAARWRWFRNAWARPIFEIARHDNTTPFRGCGAGRHGGGDAAYQAGRAAVWVAARSGRADHAHGPGVVVARFGRRTAGDAEYSWQRPARDRSASAAGITLAATGGGATAGAA